MSATYLLAHVSTGSAGGGDSTSNLNEQGHSDAVWCMSWTKLMDGRSVVITTGADHTIKIWDATNGAKPFKTIRPDCLALVGLAVDPSPDGAKFIIVNSLDSVITRWSVEGELEGMKELGSAESWGLSLHPKSLNLATAGTEAKIRIMSSSIENFGEILSVAEGRGTFGMAVEYSRDGKYLALATDQGYVSLFDGETTAMISTFPAHAAPIRSLTFTSSLLVTGSDDKRINIFDLRALAASSTKGSRKGQVASLGGHEGWVVSVQARNDRLLASGSSDGSIKLWDLSNFGSALATLRDALGDVWCVAFRPDTVQQQIEGLGGASAGIGGGELVSAGEDHCIRWWRGSGGVVVPG